MQKVLLEFLFVIFIPIASFGSPKIEINKAWIREVPPVSSLSAVYMIIENSGSEDDRLIEVNTDVADRAELHTTLIDEKDIVSMQKSKFIDIPSGKSVELKPGGSHIMLIGLKNQIKAGDNIELNLKFEKSGVIKVQAQVMRF
jgi:hypothetical protein